MSISKSVTAKKIRLRRKKYLSLPAPTIIDSEEDDPPKRLVPVNNSSTVSNPTVTTSEVLTPQGSSTASSNVVYDTPQSLCQEDIFFDTNSIRARTSRSSSLTSTPVGQSSSNSFVPTMYNPLQHSQEFSVHQPISSDSVSDVDDDNLDQRFDTTTAMEDLLVFCLLLIVTLLELIL